MIAGCIERMRKRDCGTCERRDACARIWSPRTSGENRPSLFAMLYGEIAKAARKHRAQRNVSVRRQVERELEPLLVSGAPRIERIATMMGCSRQTLYRRLKAEGLTFEQVLDELRRKRAEKLVRDRSLPVKEIGYRLGFSDPAAFSRAFKRWTGQSPATLRAQSG